MTAHRCPALLISAPASGQGKTTVTAALARHYRNRGLRVQLFKTGPDFLDPMILEQASGQAVYQLDLWMGGEDHCRQLLYQAAGEADLILIEGVMGLFDGTPSSADLALLFGIPVLAVIDATAMAQTFGALALGLAEYRPELPFAGVIANRVASPGHAEMLAESLPPGIHNYGALPRDPAMELPSRHLGLVQAAELEDLEQRLEQAASALATLEITPEPVTFTAPLDLPPPEPRLAGVRIAVARDAAFSFVYRANLDLLQAMGARLIHFSPLKDPALPPCDSLYLPGGYPELHLEALAANRSMQQSIRDHHAAGRPIVAECGGMLYLLRSLTDKTGRRAELTGLLPGDGQMQQRLSNLGMQAVELPEGTLHGHTFHHSSMESELQPFTHTRPARKRGRPEPLYRIGRLQASYLHFYLPSNPAAAATLFHPDGGLAS